MPLVLRLIACDPKRQPAENIARLYRMTVMPNLFGKWALMSKWDRAGRLRRRM